MKKLALALVTMGALAFASHAALAQDRGSPSRGGGAPAAGSHGGTLSPGWRGGAPSPGWHGGAPSPGWRGGHPGYWRGPGHGGWYGPRVGLYVGAPAFWWTWPYPYFAPFPAYYPYPYVIRDDPPVYIQPPAAAPSPTTYWYYCTDPPGYFPYVENCSRPWISVVPPGGPEAPKPLAPAQ
jgi:hypothetical protein